MHARSLELDGKNVINESAAEEKVVGVAFAELAFTSSST
jgi:hypothetical protein